MKDVILDTKDEAFDGLLRHMKLRQTSSGYIK
jgi:hypothetical protein